MIRSHASALAGSVRSARVLQRLLPRPVDVAERRLRHLRPKRNPSLPPRRKVADAVVV
jgi:hypothetical protein